MWVIYRTPLRSLDTNIRRVLHRVFVGPDVPEPAAAKEPALLAIAEKLVPSEGNAAWTWNQAVMQLGALTCTARKPHCEECPLSGWCRARARIAGALAAAPRAPKGETAYRYEDSNRFWRGRVLATLRQAPAAGVSLRELGIALREGSGEGDLAWIRTVVESLEKDGLAAVYEQRPDGERAEAVAETRPAYGTEREVRREVPARLPGGETRVRLP